VAYAGDGSCDKGVMGAGVYCLTTGNSLSARVGRETEGGSSNRPEHGAACLALRDARDDDRTLVCVSDSENMLSSIERWIGEGSLLCLHHHKDDILREILELLDCGWSLLYYFITGYPRMPRSS
jgi:ribonuclease HI